jgi:hypothetical protein
MPDEPISPTPGGASGGDAPAPAVSSPDADAALLASLDQGKDQQPDPNAEVWEKFRKGELDLTKAPQDVRELAEKPFLSISSKKVNEVEQLRQTFLQAIDRLAQGRGTDQQPVAPSLAEQKAKLLDEINNGNFQAIENLVEQAVAERTGPQMDYINTQRAISEAAHIVPDLGKYEAKVAEALKADPDLLRLASIDNRRYASRVIAALALQQKNAELESQITQVRASAAESAKKAVEDYKAQLRGLPTSTSKAGSTPTAFPPDKPLTIEQIRDQAWADAGGH